MDVGSSEDEEEGDLFPDLKDGQQDYKVGDEESEDEDENSDIEGAGDPNVYIPDEKAWGHKKNLYYNTDFVDKDWAGGKFKLTSP